MCVRITQQLSPDQIGELYGVRATPLPALLRLARQPHDGPFERRAGSARVNSVRNDDPDVLTEAPDSGLF